MHPVTGAVRLPLSGVEYCPYAPSSRLASRAPRRPKLGSYSCADLMRGHYRARPLPRLRGRPFPDRSKRPGFDARLAERSRGGRDPFFSCPTRPNCASLPSARLPFGCPWDLPPGRRACRGPPSRLAVSRIVNTGAVRTGGGMPFGRSSVARISGRLTESTSDGVADATGGGESGGTSGAAGATFAGPCSAGAALAAPALDNAATNRVWRRGGTRAALYGCSVSHVVHRVNLISSPTRATTA